jgi:hypothetical protein
VQGAESIDVKFLVEPYVTNFQDSLDELGKHGKIQSLWGTWILRFNVFNKTLLVKQGWRILQDPNSMVAQILKAKYFPRSSFLEGSLGNKPSFAWRSIFNAIQLLNQGLVWRVGDGRSIKVWGDRWLPTPTTYTVQTLPRSLDASSMVADLIDPALKR